MSPPDQNWFTLGIISAFSLATADALTKRFFGDLSGLQLVIVRLAVPGLLLLPLAILYPIPAVPLSFWLLIAILVPFELLAMWLYMLAIRDYPLHLTLPYLAFTPVFNILTGFVVLHETVSLPGLAGIILVVVGAYFLNGDQAGGRGWLLPLTRIIRNRGSIYMLIVAMIYSLTSVLGKRAMQYATPLSFGPFYFLLLGALIVAGVGCRRPGREVIRGLFGRWRQLFMVGGCMAVMIVTHFLAIARVEVAYFTSLKRTSLLFGILYGFLLFKEPHPLRHLLAGALMVAGVAMIVIA